MAAIIGDGEGQISPQELVNRIEILMRFFDAGIALAREKRRAGKKA